MCKISAKLDFGEHPYILNVYKFKTLMFLTYDSMLFSKQLARMVSSLPGDVFCLSINVYIYIFILNRITERIQPQGEESAISS